MGKAILFPPDFLWGTATSAYQVEGENRWSDWSEWETKRQLAHCDQAIRHYEFFQADFALAKSLGQNAHRLSLEWGRLEPVEGQWDERAIEHYRQVLNCLKQLGFTVCLTLNHFTLPTWLARQGGWESPQALEYFQRYIAFVVSEYGHWVDLWVTLNEPLVLATQGYWYGHWPPGVRSHGRMRRVTERLLHAHKLAYQIIHGVTPHARVGLTHNVLSLVPHRAWWGDRWATRWAERFWNQRVMDKAAKHSDFLGVNYYFHQRVKLWPSRRWGLVSFVDPRSLGREVSGLGWEVYPYGLTNVLVGLGQRYSLPLYVTENGIATDNEEQRLSFVTRSVRAVQAALAAGAPVLGYFYWSLLDNFEWDKGFGPKFGLVAVDRQTLARTPRPAAVAYAEVCRSSELSRSR